MEVLKQRLGRYKEVYAARDIKEEIMEVIVPDCNPDYEREICTHAVARVTEKSMLSGNLRVSGDLRAFTHYDSQASENMYLINAETKFSYSVDIPAGLPDDTATVTVRVLSASVEVLNSRKIRIKTKILSDVAVYRMENIELSEDACGSHGDGINVKTEDIEQTSCIDMAEKKITFTEEIRLSDEEISRFARVTRWNWLWEKEEIKILQNKIMVRGTVRLTMYGCALDGVKIDSKEYLLPFSQVVECRNVSESDMVELRFANEYCYAQIIPKDDTNTCLVCEASADANVFVYRKTEGKLLLDLYSTVYETDAVSEKIYIGQCDTDYNAHVSAQGRLQTVNGVNRVIDSCAYVVCRYAKDKIGMAFYVSVMYEDGLGNVQSARMIIENDAEMPDNLINSSVCCTVKALSVSVEDAYLNAVIEADLSAKLKNGRYYDQISSCVLDTSKSRQRCTKGNLVLRYPEKDETVWEIAKCYGTTVSAIMSANDMDDESKIACDRLIMIPFVK
ncbi:MAG: DUF3794 domain-containing protein [Clostridia bacterium]|nr:DUF3794 domain-containing protein [Clostridia bacterium]